MEELLYVIDRLKEKNTNDVEYQELIKQKKLIYDNIKTNFIDFLSNQDVLQNKLNQATNLSISNENIERFIYHANNALASTLDNKFRAQALDYTRIYWEKIEPLIIHEQEKEKEEEESEAHLFCNNESQVAVLQATMEKAVRWLQYDSTINTWYHTANELLNSCVSGELVNETAFEYVKANSAEVVEKINQYDKILVKATNLCQNEPEMKNINQMLQKSKPFANLKNPQTTFDYAVQNLSDFIQSCNDGKPNIEAFENMKIYYSTIKNSVEQRELELEEAQRTATEARKVEQQVEKEERKRRRQEEAEEEEEEEEEEEVRTEEIRRREEVRRREEEERQAEEEERQAEAHQQGAKERLQQLFDRVCLTNSLKNELVSFISRANKINNPNDAFKRDINKFSLFLATCNNDHAPSNEVFEYYKNQFTNFKTNVLREELKQDAINFCNNTTAKEELRTWIQRAENTFTTSLRMKKTYRDFQNHQGIQQLRKLLADCNTIRVHPDLNLYQYYRDNFTSVKNEVIKIERLISVRISENDINTWIDRANQYVKKNPILSNGVKQLQQLLRNYEKDENISDSIYNFYFSRNFDEFKNTLQNEEQQEQRRREQSWQEEQQRQQEQSWQNYRQQQQQQQQQRRFWQNGQQQQQRRPWQNGQQQRQQPSHNREQRQSYTSQQEQRQPQPQCMDEFNQFKKTFTNPLLVKEIQKMDNISTYQDLYKQLEEEIKKTPLEAKKITKLYKYISLLVHPDKTQTKTDTNITQAFEDCFKSLGILHNCLIPPGGGRKTRRNKINLLQKTVNIKLKHKRKTINLKLKHKRKTKHNKKYM